MPIQLNITQSTGVVATYHKVTGGGYGQTSVTANVLSYLDSTHTDIQGFAPIAETTVDISPILSVVAVATPPVGATFGQLFFGSVEQYLISQQNPNPARTAGNPLPPMNGIFFGGAQVA